MTRKTLTTTWLAQMAVVLMLMAAGSASASSGFLGGNSCRGKNSPEGDFHRGLASISVEEHQGCGDSCQKHAAGSVVAPNAGRALCQTGVESSGLGADAAYDAIRGSTADIDAIAKNTGLPRGFVERVEQHVFHEEHLLDKYVDLGVPAEMSRFQSDAAIANAWKRLEAGTHTPNDVKLLWHEYAESSVMRKLIKDGKPPSYNFAHGEAQKRFPWFAPEGE